jgi:hypothetical protein
LSAEQLQQLEAFEIVTRIGLGNGQVSAPATARTLPPPPATSDPQTIRQLSAARYGTDSATVDAALTARHGGPTGSQPDATDPPVGRTRRQP